jgi:soluble lytic murein transglycosylase-like protein
MTYIVKRVSVVCARLKLSNAPMALLISSMWFCAPSFAGNQKEEAMADSVRLALSKLVSDPRPPKASFDNIEERIKYLHWLGEMSDRLRRRLPDTKTRLEFLETVWYEAKRAGLDPALVLGLIQVESAFRKYATSVVGARGYMQVMPFWSRVIGDRDAQKLFQMQSNLRYGCAILRTYIDMEAGNLYLALGRYNGSRGRPEYPNAVLANWRNWEYKKDEQKMTLR